jgi:hypothetical protein
MAKIEKTRANKPLAHGGAFFARNDDGTLSIGMSYIAVNGLPTSYTLTLDADESEHARDFVNRPSSNDGREKIRLCKHNDDDHWEVCANSHQNPDEFIYRTIWL